MKAIVKRKYGGPEVLSLEEVEKPTPKDNQVLVKVKANSANPADWHVIRGKPYFARLSFGLFKPSNIVAGSDFAGVVEAVGQKVKHFTPGDKVFGESMAGGAFAEYVCADTDACGKMPDESSSQEMAALPIAGLTALQGIVTHGKLKAGESVLINGASGGVGHLAVQIAKAYGGVVTGVCSAKNASFVKSLGAENVIAYDEEDIHQHISKYDLIIDTHGNLSFADFTRMGKRGVLIGFTTMGNMMSVLIKSAFSKYPLKQFTAKASTEDLEKLAKLVQEGKLKVHIDKSYPHTEIPEAIAYIEKMHTRGKVVMVWE